MLEADMRIEHIVNMADSVSGFYVVEKMLHAILFFNIYVLIVSVICYSM